MELLANSILANLHVCVRTGVYMFNSLGVDFMLGGICSQAFICCFFKNAMNTWCLIARNTVFDTHGPGKSFAVLSYGAYGPSRPTALSKPAHPLVRGFDIISIVNKWLHGTWMPPVSLSLALNVGSDGTQMVTDLMSSVIAWLFLVYNSLLDQGGRKKVWSSSFLNTFILCWLILFPDAVRLNLACQEAWGGCSLGWKHPCFASSIRWHPSIEQQGVIRSLCSCLCQ